MLFTFLGLIGTLISPSYSDLEQVEAKKQNFSAWCNFPKNKCKVTIKNDRLIVDEHLGGSGIDISDIFSYEKIEEYHQINNYNKNKQLVWVHIIEYQKSDGSFSTAKIMFNNRKSDSRFSMAMQSSI